MAVKCSPFCDLDTPRISSACDQPLRFAAILTDGEVREIERVNLGCRIALHIIPSCQALAVRGIALPPTTDVRVKNPELVDTHTRRL